MAIIYDVHMYAEMAFKYFILLIVLMMHSYILVQPETLLQWIVQVVRWTTITMILFMFLQSLYHCLEAYNRWGW